MGVGSQEKRRALQGAMQGESSDEKQENKEGEENNTGEGTDTMMIRWLQSHRPKSGLAQAGEFGAHLELDRRYLGVRAEMERKCMAGI